jgi:hypothetical protein
MNQRSSSSDFGGVARLGTENFAKTRELSDIFEETNRYWSARAKSELEFAPELMAKLTNARSIPGRDSCLSGMGLPTNAAAYRRQSTIFSDSQKFLTACTKLGTA